MSATGRGPDPTAAAAAVAAVAAAAPVTVKKTSPESGDDSEEESEILEESPCGRWLKRREVVEQRDVPGIDCAYLAMDTEEGVEVVWNEVQFSERKNYKAQEDKIRQVFESLTQLQHPNIVNFHRYWTDTHNDKPRVIFITEYMSSGSLKQFLKRTKRNVKKISLTAWKRWCTQILSALSYLHSCSPPIIHGNLTCDTIFIQHNGLVKIGSVAPDTIHVHIKTCRENMKNMHFIAPECGSFVTPAIDVYAFGMCALEMASLEIQGNGDSGTLVTHDHISRTIESLDDPLQMDLIRRCLTVDFEARPSARTLLFHPVLFEVHALKLLAAHALVKTEYFADRLSDEVWPPEKVMAEIAPARDGDGEGVGDGDGEGVGDGDGEGDGDEDQRRRRRRRHRPVQFKMSDVPESNRLDKFVEDVRFGIYPLTAYPLEAGPVRLTTYQPQSPTGSTDQSVPSDRSSAGPIDVEVRRIVNMMCNIKPRDDAQNDFMMTILLRMDDKMNRQLTCSITDADTALSLSQELVHFGFINEADKDKILVIIEETLSEGPQDKDDDDDDDHRSSVPADRGTTPSTPSTPEKRPSVGAARRCSAAVAASSLRPSVIRSPVKRDGS